MIYVQGYCKAGMEELPTNGAISYPGLMRFHTYTDGSCLVHALLNAFWKPYHSGLLNGQPLHRKEFVRNLRTQMADLLRQPSIPGNPKSPINYDLLSNGALRELADSVPECSLEKMCAILDSNAFLGYVFIEFFSEKFNIDIYILDLKKMDVYIMGKGTDHLYYKGRNSVVIGYIDNHFETLGIRTSEVNYDTFFDSESPFIRKIWERKRQITG
jgi:hypothetical protein